MSDPPALLTFWQGLDGNVIVALGAVGEIADLGAPRGQLISHGLHENVVATFPIAIVLTVRAATATATARVVIVVVIVRIFLVAVPNAVALRTGDRDGGHERGAAQDDESAGASFAGASLPPPKTHDENTRVSLTSCLKSCSNQLSLSKSTDSLYTPSRSQVELYGS